MGNNRGGGSRARSDWSPSARALWGVPGVARAQARSDPAGYGTHVGEVEGVEQVLVEQDDRGRERDLYRTHGRAWGIRGSASETELATIGTGERKTRFRRLCRRRGNKGTYPDGNWRENQVKGKPVSRCQDREDTSARRARGQRVELGRFRGSDAPDARHPARPSRPWSLSSERGCALPRCQSSEGRSIRRGARSQAAGLWAGAGEVRHVLRFPLPRLGSPPSMTSSSAARPAEASSKASWPREGDRDGQDALSATDRRVDIENVEADAQRARSSPRSLARRPPTREPVLDALRYHCRD